MNTPVRKTILTLLTLLIAGVLPAIDARAAARGGSASKAGTGPRSGSNTAASRAMDNTLRRSKQREREGPGENTGHKYYIEFTPSYMMVESSELDYFVGASVALGWRITENDKLQVELGYYKANDLTKSYTYRRQFAYDRWAPNPDNIQQPILEVDEPDFMTLKGTKRLKTNAIPILFSYSYCRPLGFISDFLELRVTPTAGVLYVYDSWSLNSNNSENIWTIRDSYWIRNVYDSPGAVNIIEENRHIHRTESFSGKSTNRFVCAFGIGVGLTYQLTDRAYLDAGFRFLWTAQTSNKLSVEGTPWNGARAWNGMNTRAFTLTLGWRL